MLTTIDLDSSVIDYVIFDNSIRKIQILLSMTEDWIAKMTSFKTGDFNTIFRLQLWVQWYRK